MSEGQSRAYPKYSYWFWHGSGGRPGYRCVVNRSLLVCAGIGLALAVLVWRPIAEAASVVLFPLAGVFIGVAFGWGSHALALLQTEELSLLAAKNKGGLPDYVYTQHTAILTVFAALVAWGLGGLGLADLYLLHLWNGWTYVLAETLLYGLACLAIHECWHVVLGVQIMVLLRERISRLTRGGSQ